MKLTRKQSHRSTETLEEALRRDAPPLGRANPQRVARVCTRIATVRRPAPVFLRFHTLLRPLTRIAAGLVLLSGAAVLFKTSPCSKPLTGLPDIDPIPVLAHLNSFVDTRNVTGALATESDNLISDLTDLTTALNDRSLAILF